MPKGPSQNNGSCSPGRDGEAGRRRGKLEEAWRRCLWWRNSEDTDREVNSDVAESPTPRVEGKTNNQYPSPHLGEHPAHLLLIHTDDDGVPPMMVASSSGHFSTGGVEAGVVYECQTIVSFEWMNQDGNRPRLDWIVDEVDAETEDGYRRGKEILFIPLLVVGMGRTDRRRFMVQQIKTMDAVEPLLLGEANQRVSKRRTLVWDSYHAHDYMHLDTLCSLPQTGGQFVISMHS